MPLSLLFLPLLSLLSNVASQPDKDWTYACDSLICDPPKMCIVQDQVAQCLLVLAPTPGTPPTTPNLFGGPVFTQPPRAPEAPFNRAPTQLQTPAPPIPPAAGPTTTASPFAPLLNLFGSPPPLTLPTLPPPPTTTTTPPVNICELPPVTGNCSRARIMWYFDTETGKCERFSYSGCGNGNRFSSRLHCEETCGKQRRL